MDHKIKAAITQIEIIGKRLWSQLNCVALYRIPTSKYQRWGLYTQAGIVVLFYSLMELRPAFTGQTLSTGYMIAALALAAVVMTARADTLTNSEKIVWISICSVLFWLELRIIDEDHEAQYIQHHLDVARQTDEFRSVLEGNQRAFSATMAQFAASQTSQQEQFRTTMGEFSTNEAANQARFNRLIEHEEQVADALNGTLSPGSDPAPELATRCGFGPNDTVIIYGKGDRAIVTELPANLVRSQSRGVLLKMSKLPNGSIALTGDVRGRDGKVIVRLDSRGYVINHSGFLEVNRDKHSLQVSDDYGDEVLNLQYINSHVIRVSMPMLNTGNAVITCLTAHGVGAIFGTP